jgi:hypothetical protein
MSDRLARRLADLAGPLAATGDLPRDLENAFNGAVLLASHADAIRTLLGAGLDELGGAALACQFDALQDWHEEARTAILAACNELTAARGAPAAPFRAGTLVAANAHLATLQYADAVRHAIWWAADRDRLIECCKDESARMDGARIPPRLAAIRERFRRPELAGLPDARELIAAASGEAARAAAARGAAPANDDAESYLSAEGIAAHYGVDERHVPALRRRLERWRSTNDDSFRQVENPGSRAPRYLYRADAVRDLVEAVLRGAQRRR